MTEQELHEARAVGDFLEERATRSFNEAPIYYGELTDHFGFPSVTEFWTAHPLYQIFEFLDQEDTAKNRPFRTALVISRERSLPGQGFFNTFQQLRGPQRGLRSEDGRRTLWTAELIALLDFYKKRDV